MSHDHPQHLHAARTLQRLTLSVLLLLCLATTARTETVRLPMTIDMDLLNTMIAEQAFTEPGKRARVITLEGGCNEIWLHSPAMTVHHDRLRFQTGVSVYWGTPLAGNCLAPLIWEGILVLDQSATISADWLLRFKTLDSVLLDRNARPAPLAGLLWDLVKTHVHRYLNQIAINLGPPIDNLKEFLLSQSTGAVHENRVDAVLSSLHPDSPFIESSGVRIDILAEAPPPLPQSTQQPSPVPTMEERTRMISLWEGWDTTLIHLIDQLSDKPLHPEDRQLLLDTLLAIRYEFNDALLADEVTTAFVREQFIRSWQVLRPLFRRHLDTTTAGNILGYLSFFTAADALATIDRIGPLLGIEISRDGFFRLAFMLSGSIPVERDGVDPRLRRILGLDEQLPVISQPPLPEEAPLPAPAEPEEDNQPPPPDSSLWIRFFQPLARAGWRLLEPASAMAAPLPSLLELREWTADLTPPEKLLPRVHHILRQTAQAQHRKLAASGLDDAWFSRTMMATAWQESCFRQFIVQDSKIVYLLSYNNTSVGLMQVNEKIWRGIYDTQELRWNIRYNSMAGAEILGLYLTRYIDKKTPLNSFSGESKQRFLAAWLYALYNGGPSQLNKFPTRTKKDSLYRSDQLFLEKYEQASGSATAWLASVSCLNGQ